MKFLKIVFSIFGAILLVALLFIGGLWWKYQSVVRETPQGMTSTLASQYPLSANVNPFIGTGGIPWTCAYNYPGPSLPFGVMRLSPETAAILTEETALNTSGYFYGDDKIIGFSHTRLEGTGATDGGHFLVLPTDGEKLLSEDPESHKHVYSHENETAYPGYYAVKFPNKGIAAELTSTARVGVHRYTFSDDTTPGILLDITHALGGKRSKDGYMKINPAMGKVEGHVRTFGSFAGRYGGIKVYFAAQFSVPFKEYGSWKNGAFLPSATTETGEDLKAAFTFNQQTVELMLAISHVSIENAWENMEVESANKTFDVVTKEALDVWEKRLKSIEISGGSKIQHVNFYTAMYRAFQMPTIFNDANGEYFGFDKAVHQADSFQYFTDMSIWDTFRTTHPLYNLIARNDQQDMVRSLILMAKQGGWLPRWPSGNGYTNSMLGSASDIVISEAYQKGIRDYDVEFAFQNMNEIAMASTPKDAAFSGRRGNDDCVAYGYCPADSMEQAVSRTLEYAWSDYSIGLVAKALNKPEKASFFHEKSMQYKQVWNPETQYFQPKNADGSFVAEFDPLLLTYLGGDDSFTNDYVEGSALQWRWAPFFDAPGLINLFDNKDHFISELEDFFENTDPEVGAWNPRSYYWHGNEPDIHAPYLFNFADRPDLTQKWVRWVMDNKYTNRYDGLDGNDDGGTLSAWYIFSSLGFYPVAGTDIYQIGSPIFESAIVNMGDSQLKIVVENYAPDNIYVNKIWLNDTLLDRTWFTHNEIMNGGVLKLEMSNEIIKPNK